VRGTLRHGGSEAILCGWCHARPHFVASKAKMGDIETRWEAAVRLSQAFGDELLRFATVLVGPNDAPDLVAEAVLRSSVTLSADASERAYLFRAVRNGALDLRRNRWRRWQRDLAAMGPVSSAEPDVHADVRRAVSELSVQQRSVIFFVYWQDLTERQTAAVLGVTIGTVRRHLTRARAHLRKALK
jgi:RNA polymerase sigma factor (sigma-70 family)